MSSQQADEAFIEYYQLKHDPFQPQVPDFKFFAPQRGPVLTDLHKMARFGVHIQVVAGPRGSGKTLLRKAMQASTDRQQIATVAVLGREVADASALLGAIALGLGEEACGGSEEAVQDLIDRYQDNGQQVYLLVDDAEQLKDDALDLLERLAGVHGTADEAVGALHAVLFGASDLLERLGEAGRSGHYHLYELAPWNLQETREYLAQRLEGAGGGIELLDDQQIAEIHRESAGWPGQINAVARSVMIEGMREDGEELVSTQSSGGLPYKHLMGVLAVGMVVLIAVMLNDDTPPATGTPAPALATQGVAQGGQRVDLPLDKPAATQVVERDPVQALALPQDGQPAVVSVDVRPAPAPVAVVTPAAVVAPAPAPAPAPAAVVAPAPASVPAPAPVVKPAPAPVASKPAPAPAPVVSKPAPAPAPASVVSKPVPAPAPVATRPVEPAVKPAPVAQPAPAPAPAASTAAAGSGNGVWYMSQAGSQYTLQLLAVTSEASAQRVVSEGGADYRYFRKQVNGKPMYVVTWGRFTDRATAVAAVSRLPARFQAGKPVPQSMSAIQQYIRQVEQ